MVITYAQSQVCTLIREREREREEGEMFADAGKKEKGRGGASSSIYKERTERARIWASERAISRFASARAHRRAAGSCDVPTGSPCRA